MIGCQEWLSRKWPEAWLPNQFHHLSKNVSAPRLKQLLEHSGEGGPGEGQGWSEIRQFSDASLVTSYLPRVTACSQPAHQGGQARNSHRTHPGKLRYSSPPFPTMTFICQGQGSVISGVRSPSLTPWSSVSRLPGSSLFPHLQHLIYNLISFCHLIEGCKEASQILVPNQDHVTETGLS